MANKPFKINNSLEVTGNITTTGTVGGRNLSSDGSKLDGIAPGATAGGGSFSSLTDTTVSTTIPTITTNPSAVGHVWVNSTTGFQYICTDNTTNANVWKNVGLGSADVEPSFLPAWVGGRGVFGGGTVSSTIYNVIHYITIATPSNATDFGDLTQARWGLSSCSNGSRGCWGGGDHGGAGDVRNNVIDYVTISTTGNATDLGDLTVSRVNFSACSDGTKGVFGGGATTPNSNVIDYITISTAANATDFGDLTQARNSVAACSNATRGIWGGGESGSRVNTIDYVTIATPGNATDFGDLTVIRSTLTACSDATRGIFGGGYSTGFENTIDYITIASVGNATDFGNLTHSRSDFASCSDGTYGVFAGGNDNAASLNIIDYVTIQTTANASDFGDLTQTMRQLAGCSGD